MTKKKIPLPGVSNSGGSPYTHLEALFGPQIIHTVVSSNSKELNINSASGVCIKPKEELIQLFLDNGARQVLNKYDSDFGFLWDDSIVSISYYKKTNTATVSWWCTSPKVLEILKRIDKEFLTKNKKNLVFSIIKTSYGLDIKALGDGSSPLIEDNYNPSVIEDVKFVVDSYKKSPPPGRIAVLDGPPGTGKTHLIRSIFPQLDQVFLVLPSNLISSLDGPEFLPLLTSVRDTHEKPIVLVIEDGDACLVPRKTDNISTIASLLNLSDGILGSIIDIKMIISTNASLKEMDAAILRPGRLCRRISVEALEYEQANKVYRRLMKDEKAFLEKRREYTLAEVYERFNNKDVVFPEPKMVKKAIGFQSDMKSDSSEKRTDLTLNNVGFHVKNQ